MLLLLILQHLQQKQFKSQRTFLQMFFCCTMVVVFVVSEIKKNLEICSLSFEFRKCFSLHSLTLELENISEIAKIQKLII